MEGKKYLFPEDYMADPAAHVFNGKLFIYPSHDWEAGAEEDDDGGHGCFHFMGQRPQQHFPPPGG